MTSQNMASSTDERGGVTNIAMGLSTQSIPAVLTLSEAGLEESQKQKIHLASSQTINSSSHHNIPRRGSTSSSFIDSTREAMGKWLEKSCVREFLAEFIGTFMLIAVGGGASAMYTLSSKKSPPDTFANCFCWGVGAMIAIVATGPISGGHINPAVTVAQAILGNFSWKKVTHYLIAQYLGGFVASAVIFLNHFEAINSYDSGKRSAFGSVNSTGAIWATYPAPFVSITGSAIDQIVGTALLMFAVMAVSDMKGSKIPPWLQPMYMCLVITGLCTAYGLNCMAIFNPARDLPPRLFTAVAGWGWQPFEPLNGNYWWVTGVLGPHLGAILGGWVYYLTVDHGSLPLNKSSSIVGSGLTVDTHAVHPTEKEKINGETLRMVSTDLSYKDSRDFS